VRARSTLTRRFRRGDLGASVDGQGARRHDHDREQTDLRDVSQELADTVDRARVRDLDDDVRGEVVHDLAQVAGGVRADHGERDVHAHGNRPPVGADEPQHLESPEGHRVNSRKAVSRSVAG